VVRRGRRPACRAAAERGV